MRRIEAVWNALERGGVAGQQRIDARHPHDIYADFEPPGNWGVVFVCTTKPAELKPLRSLDISIGFRSDLRWSLRLCLQEPALKTVFAAFCEDIASSTEDGVTEPELSSTVISRIEHWRLLLDRDKSGLSEEILQGIIGELTVLDKIVMESLPLEAALASWTGPLGTPQDFQLPSGERMEVKAVRGPATTVRIHGLAQLESGGAPLKLVVVRLQSTAPTAPGAVTAPMLVRAIAEKLDGRPELLRSLNRALASIHWHDHPSHEEFAVSIVSALAYEVDDAFPKLTPALVPAGVLDAEYSIALSGEKELWLGADLGT